MKGLILKDIYTVRFQLIVSLLIMLIPNLADSILAADSISDSGDIGLIPVIFLFGAANFICISLFSSFILNTLNDDVNSGWCKIVRTMPVSSGQAVAAKFAASAVVVGITTAVSLIFNIVGIIVQGLPAEPLIMLPVCLAVLQTAVLSPVFPLAMKLGTRSTSLIYMFTLVILLSGAVTALYLALISGNSLVLLRVIFYGGLPVLAAVSVILSYRAGIRLFGNMTV